YFQLTAHSDKLARFFDARPEDESRDSDEDLRNYALFAYALAMPGETTRGRVKGMLRKIDSIAHLDREETNLVMVALDERLRLHGLEPVFETEETHDHGHDHGHEHHHDHTHEAPAPSVAAVPSAKPGRNDPCPCGSGKKYKKCHGS